MKELFVKALKPLVSRLRTDVSAVKKNGVTSWTQEPITDARLLKHVNGGPARGCSPIQAGQSVTMVGLYDLDSHKGATSWEEMAAVALELCETLQMFDMEPIVFRSSGGKGIHIYLIWDDPQDAYSVRQFMASALQATGYASGTAGVSNKQIEIFPKQDSVPADGRGNMFILPMAGESEPLELMLDLEPMGKDYFATMEWRSSAPVSVLQKPARVRAPHTTDSVAADLKTIASALAAIPNEGDQELDYDEWRNVVFALHHASDGGDDGLELAHMFSARSTKYDPDFLDERVWPYAQSRDGGITERTIFKAARDAGWVEDLTDQFDVLPPLPASEINPPPTCDTWLERIAAAPDTVALQRVAEQGIAYDTALSVFDRAVIIDAIKKRSKDLGATLPVAEVRKMVKPRMACPLPDLSAEGRPLETSENVEAVCRNEEIVIRYNVIKKEGEILIPGAQWSLDNRKEASIAALRSVLHRNEVSTKYLTGTINQLADANQYNPAAVWVTSKPWDGVSRLQAFYDTVTENATECSKQVKETMMRVWGVSAIVAIMSPTGVNARGVLVFQGQQYAGKTRWIESLVPKELDLVKTGCSLQVHDKDSVKQILSCWISELGELDSTFKRSDVAALKAFITKDTDELRRPFAQAESRYPRRTIFAASVNEQKFLHDDTGNTRFWVVPVTAINHAHGLDMQQVWAEFYTLWQGGALHYMTAEEMGGVTQNNETFETVHPIAELVATGLNWDKFDPIVNCQFLTSSQVLRFLGIKNPSRSESTIAGSALAKLSGITPKKTKWGTKHGVPLQRVLLEDQYLDEFKAL